MRAKVIFALAALVLVLSLVLPAWAFRNRDVSPCRQATPPGVDCAPVKVIQDRSDTRWLALGAGLGVAVVLAGVGLITRRPALRPQS
jgi:hypothetical protein